jgi:glucose 1-dehydrogenase
MLDPLHRICDTLHILTQRVDVMRFTGKVCVITGGGSGIGRATCLQMAVEGGSVVVADLKLDAAQATADAIAKAGGKALAVAVDVGDSTQVQAAVAKAISAYGAIHVIVNDAGMMTFTPIVDIAEADFFKVITTNLGSVFYFSKYGAPHMPPGSSIVNISSVHAHKTTANVVPYASSKGAIEAFTRGFSIEMASHQIRVNSVAPGAVDTPMLWNNPNVKSGAEKVEGAIGKPEDLANAICFIASDEAAFINGATLLVDGGRLAAL